MSECKNGRILLTNGPSWRTSFVCSPLPFIRSVSSGLLLLFPPVSDNFSTLLAVRFQLNRLDIYVELKKKKKLHWEFRKKYATVSGVFIKNHVRSESVKNHSFAEMSQQLFFRDSFNSIPRIKFNRSEENSYSVHLFNSLSYVTFF